MDEKRDLDPNEHSWLDDKSGISYDPPRRSRTPEHVDEERVYDDRKTPHLYDDSDQKEYGIERSHSPESLQHHTSVVDFAPYTHGRDRKSTHSTIVHPPDSPLFDKELKQIR